MPDDGDLIGETAHGVAPVGQEIDDLDDGDLSARGTFELNVDRSRPAGNRVDRPLGAGDPPAAAGEGHKVLLAPQVLHVARQIGTGHSLKEGSQLRIDGRRACSQRLQ